MTQMKQRENKNRKMADPADTLRATRRGLWYVLRLILMATAALLVCVGVFVEAYYISNTYIIVTEGMALRAETVLTEGAVADLKSYFTEEFVNSDYLLYEGIYADYTIDSYDYRYDIEGLSVFPWSRTASYRYVERIPSISGSANSDAVEADIPEWTSIRYLVKLARVDGRWLITELEILEENPEGEVLPTPDYSQLSPSPNP